LSADDKWLVTSGHDKTVRLWETATGKELRVSGECEAVNRAFVADKRPDQFAGRRVPKANGAVFASRREKLAVAGQRDRRDAGFVPLEDGSKLLSAGSADCSVRLWDVTSGSEVCRLVSFKGDEWATFDPERRYDSVDGGDVSGLHWVAGNETRTLSRFRRQFYVPRLFAKHLGLGPQEL
jgi:WD40 repeat protein